MIKSNNVTFDPNSIFLHSEQVDIWVKGSSKGQGNSLGVCSGKYNEEWFFIDYVVQGALVVAYLRDVPNEVLDEIDYIIVCGEK